MRCRRSLARIALLVPTVVAIGLAGCVDPAGPTAMAADVRGSWRFTADQAAPPLHLEGTLVIESQRGDLITGTISWEERDGSGVIRLDGGAVTGLVIDRSDVDFDVLMSGGSRRHVARLSTDTMQGSWLQVTNGRSGAFRAVRGPAGATP